MSVIVKLCLDCKHSREGHHKYDLRCHRPDVIAKDQAQAMTTLTDLRKLALMATPGPWATSAPTGTYVSVRTVCGSQIFTSIIRRSQEQAIGNATYIAALSPERIIALLDVIEALTAELRNIADADPFAWEPDVRDHFQAWAQNRASAALAKLEQSP